MENRTCVHHRDEVMELIECYLHCADFAPHRKLPSERELCQMWNLNRTTLRAAIRRMVELGRLYSLKGSGTYVAPPKLERNLQDAQSITESVRGAGRQLVTRVLDNEVLGATEFVAQKLQITPGEPVLCLHRFRLLDGKPYMVENNYVNLKLCPRLVEHDFGNESLYDVMTYYNVYPTEGSEGIGITYATEDEAKLLLTEVGDSLFYRAGITKESNGRPVEFFRSVTRPDMVRFSSILRVRRT